VPEAQAERALAVLRAFPVAAGAAILGCVSASAAGTGRVAARGALGAARVLDMLSGEQLPRIC
jgi:hydrogenase expression/formation protein HypE